MVSKVHPGPRNALDAILRDWARGRSGRLPARAGEGTLVNLLTRVPLAAPRARGRGGTNGAAFYNYCRTAVPRATGAGARSDSLPRSSGKDKDKHAKEALTIAGQVW